MVYIYAWLLVGTWTVLRIPCRHRSYRLTQGLHRPFAGAEKFSCFWQIVLHRHRGRVRATEHTPRDPFQILERRHCLAEIVERGGGVVVDRPRVNFRDVA